ncbi:HNH endonuclease [Saccharibacillus sacchari]|uniref:HNH endonuclease n=1 Tax=Saccharibacillus sacchari TaxID=456493 RepID=UPI0004BBF72B|nr:HNH endonuclease [Saccharibacillus sacchari]
MRRKRNQGNSSTPRSETIVAPPSSDTPNETGQSIPDARTANTRTAESSVEQQDRSAQDPSQPPRSGRKRRRRKKNASPTSTSQAAEQAAAADSEKTSSAPVEQADAPSASEAEPTASLRKRKRRRRKKSSAPATVDTGSVQRSGNPPSPLPEAQAKASTSEEAASAKPDSKPRKRQRKRRQGGAAKSAPQYTAEAAPRPKVVWPDPKPSDRTASADHRLAYAPDLMTEPEPAPQALPYQDEASASIAIEDHPTHASEAVTVKACLYCGETKPLGDFLRRTGKRSGHESRRGACRDCRKRRRAARLTDDETASDPLPLPLAAGPARSLDLEEDALETIPKRRFRRPPPEPPEGALLEPTREAELRTTKQGTVRMRGRTDKGRRWQQETDLEMARCLVREHAAVVVNRFTIRRLYTNRSFRRYILERDRYTCHFCGEYGDTIDHLLPRAKGGHTTPLNCVCACMLCNQNKADRDLDEFMEDAEPLEDLPAARGFERRPIEH